MIRCCSDNRGMLFWLFFSFAICGTLSTSRAQSPSPFDSKVKPFFTTYCIKCHGQDKSKGDIQLHALSGDRLAEKDLVTWESVLKVLQAGTMPPESEKQPADNDRKGMIKEIEAGIQAHLKKSTQDRKGPIVRRLTNIEYQNTMRDLLGFELLLAQHLPQDPTKPYQFNNTADLMRLGPEQMDRYLDCARRAMASAIVDPAKPKVEQTIKTWTAGPRKLDVMQTDEIGVYGGVGRGSPDGGVRISRWPTTGEYRIRVKAAAVLPPGYDHVPLRLVMGSLLRSDAGTGNYVPVGTVKVRNGTDNFQVFEFHGRIENHPVEAEKATAKGMQPPELHIYPQNLFDNGELNDHRRSAFDRSWNTAVPRVAIQSIEFEAPLCNTWPPEHHTRILFDSPLRKSDLEAYLRQVLERFISRAFRRPATAEEINRYVKVFHLLEPDFKTFEGAIRETLAMVLVSPNFLYHTMADGKVVSQQYALASRLSYFLWGSMPDQELLELAAKEKLDDPKVIEAQCLRLLLDSRSNSFLDNFVVQWLGIAKLHAVTINQELFPRFLYTVHVGERKGQEVSFRPTIRDSMRQETVGFIAELIRRNSSVLNIIDSDFAYLNEPLAAHYGVPGVKGLDFRPVSVKPEHRLGGLLTQGSVLVANSTGSAPHPIYRAVWLREAILGEHVKPPPAEVPALTDSAGEAAQSAVNIKEMLVKHRKQQSCAECHARLDPWGIPFEQYNAAGQYQPRVPANKVKVRGVKAAAGETLSEYQKYLQSINTVEVAAEDRLPNGPRITGLEELKKYLIKSRTNEVAENVTRRLLSYGLGREVTVRDRDEVNRLLELGKANDYKFRDLIIAICQSETFRQSSKTNR